MYCPQCGQQQPSGEMRFCSRCGFPLGGVIQLLANGGVPAVASQAGASSGKLSPRRRGYRLGLMMMLLSLIVTPVLAILSELGLPEILIPLAAIIFFWGGVIRIIYARLFEEAAAPQDTLPAYVPPAGPAQFGAGARGPQQTALPPQRSVPASGWRQPNDTAELVPPPSVTENTTRLLDDKAEPPER